MSILLAGGGIRGGQAYSASDKVAEFPAVNPVAPEDIAKTVFHFMGIDDLTAHDREGRPFQLMEEGRPFWSCSSRRRLPGGAEKVRAACRVALVSHRLPDLHCHEPLVPNIALVEGNPVSLAQGANAHSELGLPEFSWLAP